MQSLCRSLLKYAGLPGLMIGLLLALPGPARADTISTFNVTGSATVAPLQNPGCISPCSFSGTLAIDVTSGTITGVDITLPSLDVIDTVFKSQSNSTSDWELEGVNHASFDVLFLYFTTSLTPGSLVGFSGGTILSGGADGPCECIAVYNNITGSITATPEPGSIVLLLLGLGCLALFTVRKRPAY